MFPSRIRNSSIVFGVLALALAALGPNHQSVVAATINNLLTDPSFDTPLTNPIQPFGPVYVTPIFNTWGQENASVVASAGAILPHSGNGMLEMKDDGLIATQAFQRIDVTAHASDINAGNCTVDASAWFNVHTYPVPANQPPFGYVLVRFLDASFSQTGPFVISSSFPTGFDPIESTWEQLSITGAVVPINTVWVDTEVGFNNASLGGLPGYVDDACVAFTCVPEPASAALLVVGAAMIGGIARRRRERNVAAGRVLVGAVLAIAALAAHPADAALLNGSFETGTAYTGLPNIFLAGTPAPWSASSLTPDCYDNTSADGWGLGGIPAYNNGSTAMFQGMFAASGDRFLGFGAGTFQGSNFSESFTQSTAPLVGGQTYTISAQLAADDGAKAAPYGGPYTGRGQVNVYLNSGFIGTLTQNTASLTWQPRSFSFVAPNATTAVFTFVADFDPLTMHPSYVGIDDVSVTPEPASIVLTAIGLVGLLAMCRRHRS